MTAASQQCPTGPSCSIPGTGVLSNEYLRCEAFNHSISVQSPYDPKGDHCKTLLQFLPNKEWLQEQDRYIANFNDIQREALLKYARGDSVWLEQNVGVLKGMVYGAPPTKNDFYVWIPRPMSNDPHAKAADVMKWPIAKRYFEEFYNWKAEVGFLDDRITLSSVMAVYNYLLEVANGKGYLINLRIPAGSTALLLRITLDNYLPMIILPHGTATLKPASEGYTYWKGIERVSGSSGCRIIDIQCKLVTGDYVPQQAPPVKIPTPTPPPPFLVEGQPTTAAAAQIPTPSPTQQEVRPHTPPPPIPTPPPSPAIEEEPVTTEQGQESGGLGILKVESRKRVGSEKCILGAHGVLPIQRACAEVYNNRAVDQIETDITAVGIRLDQICHDFKLSYPSIKGFVNLQLLYNERLSKNAEKMGALKRWMTGDVTQGDQNIIMEILANTPVTSESAFFVWILVQLSADKQGDHDKVGDIIRTKTYRDFRASYKFLSQDALRNLNLKKDKNMRAFLIRSTIPPGVHALDALHLNIPGLKRDMDYPDVILESGSHTLLSKISEKSNRVTLLTTEDIYGPAVTLMVQNAMFVPDSKRRPTVGGPVSQISPEFEVQALVPTQIQATVQQQQQPELPVPSAPPMPAGMVPAQIPSPPKKPVGGFAFGVEGTQKRMQLPEGGMGELFPPPLPQTPVVLIPKADYKTTPEQTLARQRADIEAIQSLLQIKTLRDVPGCGGLMSRSEVAPCHIPIFSTDEWKDVPKMMIRIELFNHLAFEKDPMYSDIPNNQKCQALMKYLPDQKWADDQKAFHEEIGPQGQNVLQSFFRNERTSSKFKEAFAGFSKSTPENRKEFYVWQSWVYQTEIDMVKGYNWLRGGTFIHFFRSWVSLSSAMAMRHIFTEKNMGLIKENKLFAVVLRIKIRKGTPGLLSKMKRRVWEEQSGFVLPYEGVLQITEQKRRTLRYLPLELTHQENCGLAEVCTISATCHLKE